MAQPHPQMHTPTDARSQVDGHPVAGDAASGAAASRDRPERLFTFRSGGWVVLITLMGVGAVLAWALAPALLRLVERPPGDGETIESYAFDLDPLLIPRDRIATPLLHRDMPPAMDEPDLAPGESIAQMNAEQRGKVLVDTDRVIGVAINGEARAYPVRWLNVHEIIHDTLGGTPIAVTYQWPGDAVRVFDRRIGEGGGEGEGEDDGGAPRIVEFGHSGLVYNHNLLLYDRNPVDPATGERPVGGESLWSQLLAEAVSGDAAEAGAQLTVVPSVVTNWGDWLALHPETTVVLPDPSYAERYEGASPKSWFITDRLAWPVSPLPPDDGPPLKERIVAVRAGGTAQVFTHTLIKSRTGEDGSWATTVGGREVTLHYDDGSKTAWATAADGGPLDVTHALWFAYHAMFPDVPLAE